MAYILIVDDDEIVAQIVSERLIAAGYGCGWITDGDEALALLKWRRPDLILLDQNMPGKTGSMVLREMRGSPQFYDLPVIMFTAIEGEADEDQARYYGAQGYVRKPFDAPVLLWKIRQVLKARESRSAHRDLKPPELSGAAPKTASGGRNGMRYC